MKRVLNWFKRERFVLLGLFLFGFSVVFSVLCFIFNRLPEGLIIIGSVVGILTLNTIYFSIDTTPVLPQITQVDGVGSIIATMLFTDNTSGFYGSLTAYSDKFCININDDMLHTLDYTDITSCLLCDNELCITYKHNYRIKTLVLIATNPIKASNMKRTIEQKQS